MPLDRIRRRLPDDARLPVAVVDTARPGRRQILLANAAATTGGVTPGQSLASALAILPQLAWFERDVADEAATVQGVALAALRYTPMVVPRPTGFVAEVASCLRLFGGRESLLTALVAVVRAAGLQVAVDWAATPGAAWMLARCAPVVADEVGSATGAAAKAADSAAGCAAERTGLQTLPAVETWRQRLDALPWEVLTTLGHRAAVLAGIGCRTLGELRRLPRAGLARRCGTTVVDELDRAYGARPDPQEALVAPERFAARLELLARIETTEMLLHAVRRLLLQLAGWLGARHAALQALTLTLVHDDRRGTPPTCLDIRLAEPLAEVDHLDGLLRERFARQPLVAPVEEIGLAVDAFVTRGAASAELFPTARSTATDLNRLIEKLVARLGPDAVQRVVGVPDHRPERALRWQPADGSGTSAPAPRPAAVTTGNAVLPAGLSDPALSGLVKPGVRPVWLLPEPRPLRIEQHKPVHDGPLRLLAGPERIEAGWWDEGLATRDYYIAHNPAGQLLWIYAERQVLGRAAVWYLHGLFG